jgi:hypothetical protein
LPGGFRCVQAPYGSDVAAAAKALIDGLDHTLPGHRHSFKVLSAATQVVAGENYQLVVLVPGKLPEIVIGTVYRPLTGPLSVTNVYAIAHARPSARPRPMP